MSSYVLMMVMDLFLCSFQVCKLCVKEDSPDMLVDNSSQWWMSLL